MRHGERDAQKSQSSTHLGPLCNHSMSEHVKRLSRMAQIFWEPDSEARRWLAFEGLE